jgi:hypothetical protein
MNLQSLDISTILEVHNRLLGLKLRSAESVGIEVFLLFVTAFTVRGQETC